MIGGSRAQVRAQRLEAEKLMSVLPGYRRVSHDRQPLVHGCEHMLPPPIPVARALGEPASRCSHHVVAPNTARNSTIGPTRAKRAIPSEDSRRVGHSGPPRRFSKRFALLGTGNQAHIVGWRTKQNVDHPFRASR